MQQSEPQADRYVIVWPCWQPPEATTIIGGAGAMITGAIGGAIITGCAYG